MRNIEKIAKKFGLKPRDLAFFGDEIAKVKSHNVKKTKRNLVLVTAMTPTPEGEGKTTVTIGLNDGLRAIGQNSLAVLREPSLGPVFGAKGGATGGGRATILPSKQIDLHFTGDFHATTSAHNLLAAAVYNHIYQGNKLKIEKVVWKHAIDMNSRELRNDFIITAASEIMAILCLTKDRSELLEKLNKIIVGYTAKNEPVFAKEFGIVPAMMELLNDALLPNLVKSSEQNPVIIHGGPFANIAHGCNSLISTNLALDLADIVVEEAGFGADLGAEKWFDIKCRNGNLSPNAVVLVATIRALKYHGNGNLEKGFANLERHLENLQKFGVPVIVAVNKFNNDTKNELEMVKNWAIKTGVDCEIITAFENGANGAKNLAKLVVKNAKNAKINYNYALNDDLEVKIAKLAKTYGAKTVKYTAKAKKQLKTLEKYKLQVCIAKTPLSFSDEKEKLGAPKDFILTITDLELKNGAGFIIASAGSVILLPGLPKNPNFVNF